MEGIWQLLEFDISWELNAEGTYLKFWLREMGLIGEWEQKRAFMKCFKRKQWMKVARY